MNKLISSFFFFGLFFVCGCGLMPRFEYKEAKALIPSIREYALANIEDLSEEESVFIIQKDPMIGHANYTIYYYWWKNKEGENLFCVESFSPSSGHEPIKAYRINIKQKRSSYGSNISPEVDGAARRQ
jgi:hypothetical protein